MMTRMELHPAEWRELSSLLRDARYVPLPPLRERRLRELLCLRDRAAADMEWHDLKEFGLVVLGVHILRQKQVAAAALAASPA
jgi:hypothetical protein